MVVFATRMRTAPNRERQLSPGPNRLGRESAMHHVTHRLELDEATRTRFAAKYRIDENGCWTWTRPLGTGGYATFWDGTKTVRAHRFSYRSSVGEIPEGLVLDHLCRVRHCVNPDHLEPVSPRENALRGETIPARNVRVTICANGHPYTSENTLVRNNYVNGTPERICRQCKLATQKRWRMKQSMKGAV